MEKNHIRKGNLFAFSLNVYQAGSFWQGYPFQENDYNVTKAWINLKLALELGHPTKQCPIFICLAFLLNDNRTNT